MKMKNYVTEPWIFQHSFVKRRKEYTFVYIVFNKKFSRLSSDIIWDLMQEIVGLRVGFDLALANYFSTQNLFLATP